MAKDKKTDELARLVQKGKSNHEIADELELTLSQVRNRRSRLKAKSQKQEILVDNVPSNANNRHPNPSPEVKATNQCEQPDGKVVAIDQFQRRLPQTKTEVKQNVIFYNGSRQEIPREELDGMLATLMRETQSPTILLQAINTYARLKQLDLQAQSITTEKKEDEWETGITAEEAALQFEEFLTKYNYNLHLRDRV